MSVMTDVFSYMRLENFIRDALFKPNDYIAYHVGRKLAELHPGKTIIEGRAGYFDLEAFVRAEKCSIVEQKSVFNNVTTAWRGVGKKLGRKIENAWLHVLWSGQLLEVVLITWSEGCHRLRHQWIIADEPKLAERFFQAVCEWSCEVRSEILVYQGGFFEKNKELFESIKKSTFDNLVLPVSLKERIQSDFAQFFQSRDVYDRHKIPWKRGAIFIGPAGNGKTHTVKALVNSFAKPCLYVRSFKSEYATDQENIAEVFKRARMTIPCFVVLEDLDSMLDDANRSFFLNELDGFETNTGVVVLATTNHPEKLDSAIIDRPSRFDRKYSFGLPSADQRQQYVEKWNAELQAELRVSARAAAKLVQQTEGFSFAYMKELYMSSMSQWMATEGKESMDEVILAQSRLLSLQMQTKKTDN